jgi:hypothetical protein
MPKLDLKKDLKALYSASAQKATLIDVPRLNFLMVDGEGEPGGTPAFQEAIGLLYSTSYTLKFASKKADPERDWAVMPLEGLWMIDGPRWSWRLMIAQPGFVTVAEVKRALTGLAKTKGTDAYSKLRLEKLAEGKCVQMMHIGPYSAEEPTIERMREFARENGYEFAGRHHEIYFSDPKRVPAEKLKTILRYPVRKTPR